MSVHPLWVPHTLQNTHIFAFSPSDCIEDQPPTMITCTKLQQLVENDLVACIQCAYTTFIVSHIFEHVYDVCFIHKVRCTIQPILVVLRNRSPCLQLGQELFLLSFMLIFEVFQALSENSNWWRHLQVFLSLPAMCEDSRFEKQVTGRMFAVWVMTGSSNLLTTALYCTVHTSHIQRNMNTIRAYTTLECSKLQSMICVHYFSLPLVNTWAISAR